MSTTKGPNSLSETASCWREEHIPFRKENAAKGLTSLHVEIRGVGFGKCPSFRKLEIIKKCSCLILSLELLVRILY